MSSSNTDLLSKNETTTKVALPSSDNAEADMHNVTTLVKAFKDGATLDASYNAILKAIVENEKSRDALMKAMTENTKLHGFVLPYVSSAFLICIFACRSPSMAADFPNAVEITSDFKASAAKPTGVVKKLTPAYGTKGFSNQIYRVVNSDWLLDVYAYRHANSDDVTVIVLHSGSTPSEPKNLTGFTFWTTTDYRSHYPTGYDADLGDEKFSYHIDYAVDINMIGPDGRNPILFSLLYNETFTAQLMGSASNEPPYLTWAQMPGRIHGMSVFNTKFKVGTSIFIELDQQVSGDHRAGRIQVTV
ncbi:hypothetical protein BDP27DRAFT_1457219 [Rhodocollybia butyracea]|uniref:Uncharacterized protein n=1 Tax=Rhodocollybia butyracea TaxID=206335 RepID=A0A9P5TVU1_9AGAR|nr:hypothetical protein BDP27DRAFT_1457219 [Rhodocollybia butyracea]